MGGGFSYGQLGMSHHATEDLSIIRALPKIKVLAPGTIDEVRGVVKSLYESLGPAYLRLDKSKHFIEDESFCFQLGKAYKVREGDSVTLISTGGILEEVVKAADDLKESGIYCRVLSMHTVKPIDIEALKDAAINTGGIISIEENSIIGGLGGAIAENCLEYGVRPSFFKRIGLDDTYSSIVGDQKYLRNHYRMDAQHIVEVVKGLVSQE